jgi:hypothetical protein
VLEGTGHVTVTLQKLHFAARSGAVDFHWASGVDRPDSPRCLPDELCEYRRCPHHRPSADAVGVARLRTCRDQGVSRTPAPVQPGLAATGFRAPLRPSGPSVPSGRTARAASR